MKMRFLVCLSIVVAACAVGVSGRKNWALLIAGSNGYDNYRHQADVCHAYQILHAAGIPDSQIIVMMYDDVANSTENPYPGTIINKPNGPNVYPGVPKDYVGADVNAEMFLAVLQGNKGKVRDLLGGRDGKVIDSGPDDYVFVNFADHGSPGFLCTPTGPYIKARDLNNALKDMHQKNRFAKLLFYVEACFSGSVFADLLPKDINVYVTTAANPTESSYACYWDNKRSTFLGDVYSVKWMEDTDAADLHKETFQQQYETVKKETTTSHVMQYGDLSIASFVLDKFFGNNLQFSKFNSSSSKPSVITDQIPSEMVPIQTLKNRIAAAPANSEKKADLERKLFKLQTTMSRTHDLFWDIAKTVYGNFPEKTAYNLAMKKRETIQQWDCYETVVDTLLGFCPGLDINNNDFALRRMSVLVNLCNHNHIGKIIPAVETASSVNPLCRV